MENTIDELFEEKTRTVLERIRSDNTGDDALKFTQALRNIVDASIARQNTESNLKTKKQGAGS